MLKRIFFILLSFCFLVSISQVNPAFCQISIMPSDYLDFVQGKINSNLVYPIEALEKGWQGIVKVKFTIAADGVVKEIYITESSGFPVLDAGAIFAVKDSSPYPVPPNNNNEIEITIPLQFALNPPAEESGEQSGYQEFSQEQRSEEPLPVTQQQEGDNAQGTPASYEAQPIGAVSEEPTAPEEPSINWPEDLGKFVDIAVANYKPSQVAKKEVEYADVKLKEAKRNLLPTLKVASYTTKGETYHIPYEEWELKFEIDQPVYYGGRLVDAVDHAKVNLEIAQRNFDRIKYDLYHKTETAYYNVVASRTHYRQKEKLVTDAKELLDKVAKLAESGMIIPVELDSAKSYYEQIKFQLSSLKEDMRLAELTFRQVLNAEEVPEISVQDLQIKQYGFNDAELLNIALKYRPEVYIGELTVRFSELAKKIEKDKDDFAVDLLASYGRYGGHYETEDWKNSDNWQAGIKVSKPFGASTLKNSFIHDNTRPRLGTTSPTMTDTMSSEFSLLDNLQGVGAKKKAEVDLERSISDLHEVKKTVQFEVQDAFLNYQKSIQQLNTAAQDMIFRRNQAEITKIKSMVNEVPLSSTMESLFELCDSQTKYFQALGNYFIAIANLRKATGYGVNLQ